MLKGETYCLQPVADNPAQKSKNGICPGQKS